MANGVFNIYDYFPNNTNIPFITINNRNSDKREYFKEGITTYDALSYKFYGTSLYGRIISMANPEFDDEFSVADGSVIRIPFPINDVISEVVEKINLYNSL